MAHFFKTAAVIWLGVILLFLIFGKGLVYVAMPRGWHAADAKLFFIGSLYGWTVLLALVLAGATEILRAVCRR